MKSDRWAQVSATLVEMPSTVAIMTIAANRMYRSIASSLREATYDYRHAEESE